MKRHEKELGQYFEDWKNHDAPWKVWECKRLEQSAGDTSSGKWSNWHQMQRNYMSLFGHPDYDFRRKPEPKYINIACNVDLPLPIKKEPNDGDDVYAFCLTNDRGWEQYSYHNGSYMHSLFKNGCLFSSKKQVLEIYAFWKEHFSL